MRVMIDQWLPIGCGVMWYYSRCWRGVEWHAGMAVLNEQIVQVTQRPW